MRKGRSASYLGTPGPPRERRRALAHSSRRIPGPQPPHHTLGPGQVCARGEPAAGVSAFTARRVLFVCLPRAGSSLFTGESHPETQALFLSGLSQVEESIKPPDRGPGRHSGARRRSTTSGRQAPGSDPCSGHARALAQLLPLRLAPARRPGHLQEGR